MIGLLTAAPTHAPGVISFTIEQLWQMILSIAGGITAISAAVVVIVNAIKKAKEPDTKQNLKLTEHDKHLEDIDRLYECIKIRFLYVGFLVAHIVMIISTNIVIDNYL